MKRDFEPSKFYYDVTIEHDASELDTRFGFASKAEKMINLKNTLIVSPGL